MDLQKYNKNKGRQGIKINCRWESEKCLYLFNCLSCPRALLNIFNNWLWRLVSTAFSTGVSTVTVFLLGCIISSAPVRSQRHSANRTLLWSCCVSCWINVLLVFIHVCRYSVHDIRLSDEYNPVKCGSVELFMDSRCTIFWGTFFHSYHIKHLDNPLASQWLILERTKMLFHGFLNHLLHSVFKVIMSTQPTLPTYSSLKPLNPLLLPVLLI